MAISLFLTCVFKQRPSRKEAKGARRSAATKAAPAYWRERVFRNSYTRSGRRVLLRGWSVKIQYQGHRHTFSLAGATRHAAGREAKALHDRLLEEGWDATLRLYSPAGWSGPGMPRDSVEYWREALVTRHYHFPISGQGDQDLGAMISHAGRGYFFPLGSPERAAAAARACEIYRTIVERGWDTALRAFSRELVVGLEWCSNPSLSTYTTIHTLVGSMPPKAPPPPTGSPMATVLVLDPEPGIRRGLSWCIDQASGFRSEECDALAALPRAIARYQPQMVLLNRNLSPRLGYDWPAHVALVAPGVLAVPYTVAVDGEYLFAATSPAKEGYVFKRVKPWSLLGPMLDATGRPGRLAGDYQARVRSYFSGLLAAHPKHGAKGLATLTRREHEVFQLLSKGYVDKEIANLLRIGFWTVHGYIKSIFRKLQVRTRTEAARYLER